MNKVILIGRLTDDPELRFTQGGDAICEFSLAVDDGFGDNKKTSFIKQQCWRKTAEQISKTLTKGRKILVEGTWIQQRWEKDGVKKYKDFCRVDRFEYLDKKEESKTDKTDSGYDVSSFGTEVFSEEEIPF